LITRQCTISLWEGITVCKGTLHQCRSSSNSGQIWLWT